VNSSYRQTHVAAFLFVVGFLLAPMITHANIAPVVSNVVAVQRDNSYMVDITYDLVDPDGDPMWITIVFLPHGVTSGGKVCVAISGDVGPYVYSGMGLSAEWDSRIDYPDLISDTCKIRVIASDSPPYPYIDAFWKSDLDGSNQNPLAMGDTLAFGHPFRLRWQGYAPAIVGINPQLLASLDNVYPYDDGLLGYKYDLLDPNCIPSVEDCWQPRRFNEATGDSVSFFGPGSSLDFHNDGSGADPFHKLLPSGEFNINLNALDVFGQEIREYQQFFPFVVNYDPETIILNGETDWAHPEDPEVYPYYFLLNDPLKTHHPFQSGDRIPDRSYVVVKALGRDDSRDLKLDENFKIGISGFVRGTRQNLNGGYFSFQSESSVLNPDPPWPANEDGWSADTLGFLTGPRTEFTFNMQAVDEHGRKDGTPGQITFEVGYPPCIQCIEILPRASLPSVYDETLACLEDTSAAAIAAHPCFGDTTILRITENGLGDHDLDYLYPAFMLVDKSTGFTQVVMDPGLGGEDNYEIGVRVYRMVILLHGLDDLRERWERMDRRLMGCMYQVDYDCDPFNQIQDGGGIDDISQPTWGETFGRSGLEVEPISGLWRISVDVAVPRDLISVGPELYKDISLRYSVGIEDPEIRDRVFNDTTKQFGKGRVQAITLDQARCDFFPVRPAKYNFFRQVRPSVAELPAGRTWRDCDLTGIIPGLQLNMDLSLGAMLSLDGEPVPQYFRIIVETATGDFECYTTTGFQ